ncbi:hypothetical protein SEA_CONLEY_38 [Gordonia phage Conley]|uniref:Uncharacterized protein n=1 Tax=Gordonia phage Petito TaxID=3158876 RepID=A0AAU8GTE4_9CAUD|nr:hypothetical protein SEA_CONLEY_38 [Gordonia phage Conley]
MNTEKIVKAKKHVIKHRAKYAAATTLALCVAAHIYVASAWNEFLDENEMLDEFYADPE